MKKLDITCLIDDDQMFTYLVSKQMRLIDFCGTVLIFNDGDEALKYLRPIVENPETLPSVILLDINMPVLDGWQFLDEFCKFKIAKKITVYIVSSSIDQADQLKAASYKEVSNFYVKPIIKEHLVEMLKESHWD
ncbi:MAG: response regulator [Sphingobacteriales bacterium]|nr:MAG: response regulator [Sphingobacteriales bacterium]